MVKFKFNKDTDSLFGAILSLKTKKEAEMFFRDLCTVEEIKEMSDRWRMAKMLDKGVSYRNVATNVGVSTTTVSRVAAWLFNGEGGYRIVLDRMFGHHNSSKDSRKS